MQLILVKYDPDTLPPGVNPREWAATNLTKVQHGQIVIVPAYLELEFVDIAGETPRDGYLIGEELGNGHLLIRRNPIDEQA